MGGTYVFDVIPHIDVAMLASYLKILFDACKWKRMRMNSIVGECERVDKGKALAALTILEEELHDEGRFEESSLIYNMLEHELPGVY